MFVTQRWLCRAALATALLANGAPAHAQNASARDSRAECAGAYERAQEHRGSGELSLARAELAICQQADCPAFIRSDCAGWSKEVEAAQPSVVFSAKRGAQTLTDVRVFSGNRILAEQLQGQHVEIDPGNYDFRFETPGSEPIVQHAAIVAGEKGRTVEVEFPSADAESARAISVSPALAPSSHPHRDLNAPAPASGAGPLPWTLVAIGAAGIGAGVGLSIWGRKEELHLREECSPNCSDASVQPVRTKYLLADVSFGVGIASLATAVYLFVRGHDSAPTAGTTAPVDVVADSNAVVVHYGSRF